MPSTLNTGLTVTVQRGTQAAQQMTYVGEEGHGNHRVRSAQGRDYVVPRSVIKDAVLPIMLAGPATHKVTYVPVGQTLIAKTLRVQANDCAHALEVAASQLPAGTKICQVYAI